MTQRPKHRLIRYCAPALAIACASHAWPALIVNPPHSLTHQVTVQLIETALDNGTSPATVFGNSTRRAAIEATVDTVMAQAGIDVHFLPNVVRYNSTFAYQGLLPPTVVRPVGDLAAMITGAQLRGGILHPDPSVINMFFVNVVPGFNLKGASWANGVGNLGSNGIAMFIGASTSVDHASHWVSHEIGHNLGLMHTDPVDNLMNSGSRRSSTLTPAQIAAVFQTQPRSDAVAVIPAGGTGFPKPLPPQAPGDFDRNGMVDAADYAIWRKTKGQTDNLAADANGDGIVDGLDFGIWRANFGNGMVTSPPLLGDYNSNGVVDAADYAVWRKSLGSTTNLAADGNGNGIIDASDYTTWRSQFGRTVGTAASTQFLSDATVPEPGTGLLIAMGLTSLILVQRRVRQS